MDTPTYNADGEAVWKPQPGEYYSGGLRYVQSYGGVVSALQDLQASKGDTPKAYPNNFAGIIAAVEDLQEYLIEGTLPEVDAPPDGWQVITNPDGSYGGGWQDPPKDGTLWFDIRQGRMFIAIDNEFYQTNGADGLASVGPNPPTTAVIGSTWINSDTGLFYVYTAPGQWEAIVSSGDITLTTATLPLSSSPFSSDFVYSPQILPPVPPAADMQTQQDYNIWLSIALTSLDKAITESSVTINDTPPTDNVVPGTLWYDSQTLELSIYYEDDDGSQWVPVSTGFAEKETITRLREAIDEESLTRSNAVTHIYSTIAEVENDTYASINTLNNKVDGFSSDLSSLQIPDTSDLATNDELLSATNRIAALETAEVDFSGLATLTKLQEEKDILNALIAAKSDLTMADVTALLPDISNKVEQADIDGAIAAIVQDFLPKDGGTIEGSFVVNKPDVSIAAFDVSSSWWNSQQLFKLKSYSPDNSTATFGATDQLWQYAWQFSSKEDFAWIHSDAGKTFSISKDGPACTQLHIGNFQANNSDGRVITNTIEVGEELRKFQQAFTDIRTAVNSSTDYHSLKANLLQALSGL